MQVSTWTSPILLETHKISTAHQSHKGTKQGLDLGASLQLQTQVAC